MAHVIGCMRPECPARAVLDQQDYPTTGELIARLVDGLGWALNAGEWECPDHPRVPEHLDTWGNLSAPGTVTG